MGPRDAESQEHGVASSNLVVTPAACPVPSRQAGAPSLSGGAKIRITRGTLGWEIYGRDEAVEQYFCNYEVNPAYRGAFEAAGLVISANSEIGEPRMLELPGHPFFAATLFQPQLSSAPGNPHPLFMAFLRACAVRAGA